MSKIIIASLPGFLYLIDQLFYAYTHCQQYAASTQMGEGIIGYRDFILFRILLLSGLVFLGGVICKKNHQNTNLVILFVAIICVFEISIFITIPEQQNALSYTKACFPYGA